VISGAVIGRDAELDFVRAFLDDVRGGPAGLVLSGEAGIGKTILWQAGVERALGCFAHVLTCRGAEAEGALSFAGLSELLSEVLGNALDSLLPPRRRALEVALLLAEPGEGPPDPLAIGLAVHDVLRVSAQEGPVLVAVARDSRRVRHQPDCGPGPSQPQRHAGGAIGPADPRIRAAIADPQGAALRAGDRDAHSPAAVGRLRHQPYAARLPGKHLGYGAYLALYELCRREFPDIADQTIAKLVSGIDVVALRPDDELRRLAALAVQLGVAS
jgi:hypothetical protein